jgi:ferric-dicitrate binding protein FerR (iron transport regulator)
MDKVFQSDTLKTATGASLVVRFKTGSRIELGPDSRLVLAGITEDSKNTLAHWGKFNFNVKKEDSKGRFKVTTPVAIAGAEGTMFDVIIDQSTGQTQFNLTEGELDIKSINNNFGAFRLKQGQSVSLNSSASAPKISKATSSPFVQNDPTPQPESANPDSKGPKMVPNLTPQTGEAVSKQNPLNSDKAKLTIEIQRP